MFNLNRVTIIGFTTSNIEVKELESGTKLALFSVATNKRWKNQDGEPQEETEFHNCVAWGKQAEFVDQYLEKGKFVRVEGRLKTRSWEDKETQKTMYRTEIIVESLGFLDRKNDNNTPDPNEPDNSPEKPVKKTYSGKAGKKVEDEIPDIPEITHESDIKPEDLPF